VDLEQGWWCVPMVGENKEFRCANSEFFSILLSSVIGYICSQKYFTSDEMFVQILDVKWWEVRLNTAFVFLGKIGRVKL
jgi:hypothetical protein